VYWGYYGLCALRPLFVYNSSGQIVSVEILRCGTTLVKEWYICEEFKKGESNCFVDHRISELQEDLTAGSYYPAWFTPETIEFAQKLKRTWDILEKINASTQMK